MPGRLSEADALGRIGRLGKPNEAAGRPADSIRIMRHVSMLVRDTDAEVERVRDWLASPVDLDLARRYVSGIGQRITTYRDVYQSYDRDDDTLRRIAAAGAGEGPLYLSHAVLGMHDAACRAK